MTSPLPSPAADRAAALHAGLGAHPAALFQLDPRLARGWLSDRYFVRAQATLARAGRDPVVTMQLFAKQHGVLAGMYEAIRLLQVALADGTDARALELDVLLEGDRIAPWESVAWITGPYRLFAHLETPLLGVLARRTLVATNVRAVVDAARGRTVIFMGARHDDWRVQTPDGYAARIGGAASVSSDAGGAWWGGGGAGTMPHALIAAFDGDTVAATVAFAEAMRATEPTVAVVSLVDYHNDVVRESLAVARAMRERFGPGALAGVRVDTSEKLVDASLVNDPETWGRESPTGVTPALVRRLRVALDDAGFSEVGIVVSGGFTPARIRRFEEQQVPVAAYGIGSSLLGHNAGAEDGLLAGFDFTADIVHVDGHAQAKVGRRATPNPRFVRVDWNRI